MEPRSTVVRAIIHSRNSFAHNSFLLLPIPHIPTTVIYPQSTLIPRTSCFFSPKASRTSVSSRKTSYRHDVSLADQTSSSPPSHSSLGHTGHESRRVALHKVAPAGLSGIPNALLLRPRPHHEERTSHRQLARCQRPNLLSTLRTQWQEARNGWWR